MTLALPYAATAAMTEAFHCHHAGAPALADGKSPPHHHDAAMAMMGSHHAGAQMTHASNCDCPLKCACAQHCAGGGGGAALAPAAFGIAPVPCIECSLGGLTFHISNPDSGPLFRPPIAALPSAA